MFKFIVKMTIAIFIGFVAYQYFFEEEEVFNADIPEVSFNQIKSDEVNTEEDVLNDVNEDEESIEDNSDDDTVGGDSIDVQDDTDIDILDDEEDFNQNDDSTDSEIIADSVNLAVPFTSQAPHSNWDFPYQEMCEEASAYMVSLYFSGEQTGRIDADIADKAMLEFVSFEEDYLGTYLDTTASQTSEMIDIFYGFNTEVVDNPTVEEIKIEISNGYPVIVFTAGQELNNPFFSGEGPLYHVFVIKGFTESEFITNDPGTKHGNNFVYEIDDVMSAMGDWNNGDPSNGVPRVLFVRQ